MCCTSNASSFSLVWNWWNIGFYGRSLHSLTDRQSRAYHACMVLLQPSYLCKGNKACSKRVYSLSLFIRKCVVSQPLLNMLCTVEHAEQADRENTVVSELTLQNSCKLEALLASKCSQTHTCLNICSKHIPFCWCLPTPSKTDEIPLLSKTTQTFHWMLCNVQENKYMFLPVH